MGFNSGFKGLRMFSRTAHPTCVHDWAHNYAEGFFFFFAFPNAFRPNISIKKYSRHEATNGLFPLINNFRNVEIRYGRRQRTLSVLYFFFSAVMIRRKSAFTNGHKWIS